MKKIIVTLALVFGSIALFAQTDYDFIPERKSFTFADDVHVGLRSIKDQDVVTVFEDLYLYLNNKYFIQGNYDYSRGINHDSFRSRSAGIGFGYIVNHSSFAETMTGLSAVADWQKYQDGSKTCRVFARLNATLRIYYKKGGYFTVGTMVDLNGKKIRGTLFSVGMGRFFGSH